MDNVTEEAIGEVVRGLAARADAEIAAMSQAELEERWFFRWDAKASVEWNAYQFHDLLKLYGSFCRRWEEHHNGCCCVVERVRDTYLMPKIRAFLAELKTHNAELSRVAAGEPKHDD